MKFDVDRALQHSVVLLAGDEPTLRRRALEALVEAASAGDDFDVEQFNGDNSAAALWLASAGTAPFLSPRRVAVVRNLLRNTDPAALNQKLPSSGLLILVADEERPTEGDRAKGSTAQAWQKAVEKVGGYCAILKLEPGAVVQQLRESASAEGKEMSPGTASLLCEMCGGSYSRAADELDKLILFVGNEKRVTDEVVQAVVVPSREWNIFKLIGAVQAGSVPEAFTQLRNMIGSQAKAEGVAFSTILPLMSRHFRLLYQARLVLDAGGNGSNIPDSVRAHFPAKPNLAEEKDYPRRLAFDSAKSLSLPKISHALGILAHTDARLKGQAAGFSAMDTLERMVLELIAVMR